MQRPVSPSHIYARRIALIVILSVHALLALTYSLMTPLWESFDEPGHYSYARYIAIHRELPPIDTKASQFYDETRQPPLYYLLVAIPISFVDTSDDAQPHYTAGGNTFVVADKQLNAFPYHGTALALHLGRLVSVILGTIAVAVTYAIVRTAVPQRVDMALFAAALHAFWPSFLSLSGAISNDVGMAVVGSFTTLFVVRLAVKPVSSVRHWDYLGLVVSAICATQTKDNGLALVLFAVAAVLILILRDVKAGHYRSLVELLCFVAAVALLIALGGVLTDGRSYRQLLSALGFGKFLVSGGESPSGSLTSQIQILADSVGMYASRLPTMVSVTLVSMFSSFSWGFLNIPAEWLQIVNVAGIIALVEILIALVWRQTRAIALLMLLCVVCVWLAPLLHGIYQGRYVLPSLSAIVVLISIGLFLLPRLIRRVSAAFALVVVQMVALMSPFVVMAPEYQVPTLLDPAAMPANMQALSSLKFGDSIQLLGYSYPTAQVKRGQDAAIILYWRALQAMPKDYAIKLELFSVNGESFGSQSQATPGNSNFPTSSWKPGDTFAETYLLPTRLDNLAPTLAAFKITWFSQPPDMVSWNNPQVESVLSPTCEGVPCDAKVGALPVRLDDATAAQWAGKAALYRLGQHIEMVDYHAPVTATAGQPITVSVVWRANAGQLGDLTTFVHLFSPDGKFVAQVDSPPLQGHYPTSVWGAGEVVPDVYTLPLTSTLSPGTYQLKIGMYDAKTHDRLSASDAAGAALADNVITLQNISVGK